MEILWHLRIAWVEILTKISEILQIKKPQKKNRYAAISFWRSSDLMVIFLSKSPKFHFFLEKSLKLTISIVKISVGDHVTEIKKQKIRRRRESALTSIIILFKNNKSLTPNDPKKGLDIYLFFLKIIFNLYKLLFGNKSY